MKTIIDLSIVNAKTHKKHTCAYCEIGGHSKHDENEYHHTRIEQAANVLTHLLPAMLAAYLTYYMLLNVAVTQRQILCTILYGGGITVCFIASTIYHIAGFFESEWTPFFLLFDYSSIFINIAASFTPWTIIVLYEHTLGSAILLTNWALALLGIANVFMKFLPNISPVSIYPLMTSLAIPMIYPLTLTALSPLAVVWLLVGLGWFAFGFSFFGRDEKIPYAHAIFHSFVAIGNFSHWYGVLTYVMIL